MESFNTFLASPIGLVTAAVACVLVGWLFVGVKQWEAQWKEWAIDTAGAASKAGCTHIPKFLKCLAVEDLGGAFKEIKSLGAIFADPKQLKAEFQTVFANMVDAAKADPQELAALQALIADASKGAASTVLAADAAGALALNPLTAVAAPPTLAAALLPHLPALAASPVLQNIASVLQGSGLGHLLPGVIAGHSAAQATLPSSTNSAPPPPAPPAPQSPPANNAADAAAKQPADAPPK